MTVNPTNSAAPAGWYRDPLGIPQLRWWNGIGWTNHIQEERAELHANTSETSSFAPAFAVA